MKALEAIRLKPDYTSLKVAYGKDRCANPPRSNSGPQNGQNRNRTETHVTDSHTSPNPQNTHQDGIHHALGSEEMAVDAAPSAGGGLAEVTEEE
jgi:hypothetical protein